MNISKITLGTAQLGLDYGISNINGKPNLESSFNILNYAWENNINSYDTSPAYGNSEEIIGSFFSNNITKGKENLVIISKMPAIKRYEEPTFDNVYRFIKNQINQSINKLKINKIPIYLLHHAHDIYFKDGIVIECLSQIKKEEKIGRFGISAYNPKEVEASLEFKNIDVIQVPINIFDLRLITRGLLKKLKKKNYLIFARSIYLQGLFFIHPKRLLKNMGIAIKPINKLIQLINEYNIDIAQLAFSFVRDLSEITSLVIGAEKKEQIANNLRILKSSPLSYEIRKRIIEEFSELPEKLINPSLWSK